MTSIHPRQADFHQILRGLLPSGIAGFLGGVATVSSAIWDQGGITIEISHGLSPEWTPSSASARDELLEFFACVCGNRSLERTFEAEQTLDGLETLLRMDFPEAELHLELEPHERTWSYTLHALISSENSDPLHVALFWSVD